MSNHPRKKEKKKKKNTTEIASSSTHFASATKKHCFKFLSRRRTLRDERLVLGLSLFHSLAVRHPSLSLMKVIKQCQADAPLFIARVTRSLPSGRGNSFSFEFWDEESLKI